MPENTSDEQLHTSENANKVIIYDGKCPICENTAKMTRSTTLGEGFTFISSSNVKDLESYGLNRSQIERYVVMVDSTGSRIFFGIDVVIALLLSSKPKPFRTLARILAISPIHSIAEALYDWVSRHRYEIAKLVSSVHKMRRVVVSLFR